MPEDRRNERSWHEPSAATQEQSFPLESGRRSELMRRLCYPMAQAEELERRLECLRKEEGSATLPLDLHWEVVRAYLENDQFLEALRVLLDVERLTGCGTAKVVAYDAVIHELCRKGYVREAVDAFQHAGGASLWQQWHNIALLLLDNCYARGLEDLARELLSDMIARGELRAATLGPFVSKAVECGSVRTAEAIIEEMIASGFQPRTQTFTALMGHYSAAADAEAVERIANIMHEVGTPHSRYTYSFLIKARAKAGLLDDALDLFKMLPEHGFKPISTAFTILVQSLARAARTADAESVLNEMKAQGHQCPPHTLCDLAAGYVKANKCEHAMEVLQGVFVESGYSMTPGLLALVHKAACAARNLSFAAQLVDTYPRQAGSFTLRHLAAAYAALGEYEEMLASVEQWHKKKPRSYTHASHLLEDIMDAAEEAGRGEEIMDQLEDLCRALGMRTLPFCLSILPHIKSKERYEEIMRLAAQAVRGASEGETIGFLCRLLFLGQLVGLDQVMRAMPRAYASARTPLGRAVVKSIDLAYPERTERAFESVKLLKTHGLDTVLLYRAAASKLFKLGFVECAKQVGSLEETGQVTGWLNSRLG